MEDIKLIVLISGYRTHGKDYMYKVLIGENVLDKKLVKSNINKELYEFIMTNKNYKRVSFADELKKECYYNLGLDKMFNTLEEMESAKDEEIEFMCYSDTVKFKSVRELLIYHGQLMRTLNEDYWIRKVAKKVKENDSNNYFNVITDWRFPSEFHNLSKLLGNKYKLLKIRVNDVNKKIPKNELTENSLDDEDFDLVFSN